MSIGRPSSIPFTGDIAPSAIAGAPDCPASLKGVAKETWGAMTTLLANAGTLTKLDGHALERYCTVYARWKKAEASVARAGAVKKGRRGEYQNCQLFVANKCIEQMETLEKRLGIDLLTRKKLGLDMKPAGRKGVAVRDRNVGPPPPKGASA